MLFSTFNNCPLPIEIKLKILRYINVFVKKEGSIPFPLIYWAALKNLPIVVKFLLEYDIRFDDSFYEDVNVKTKHYSHYGFNSIIHGCVENRNIQILRLIMKYDRQVFSTCNYFGDVFQTTIACGNLKAFKMFINESKTFTHVNNPCCLGFGANSTLHLICYTRRRKFLNFFFKYYKIPKKLYFGKNNDDEMIPLELALKLKNYVVAKYILENGPKLEEYHESKEYLLDKWR